MLVQKRTVQCGFTQLQMCMSFGSLLRWWSTRMLKKRSLPCCRRNWKNSWDGRKSGGFGEFVPIAHNGTFMGNSPNCHARHTFGISTPRTLVLRFASKRLSMRFSTQSARAVLRISWSAAEAGTVPVSLMWHQCSATCAVRKSTSRIHVRLQSYSCCNITMRCARNEMHICVFLKCVTVHFKQSDKVTTMQWTAADRTCSSLANALVNYHCKHDGVFHCWPEKVKAMKGWQLSHPALSTAVS
jgi:hypothetical protein